jgi:C1A family cysteine protease
LVTGIDIYDLVKRIRGRKMAEFQGKYQLIILCNKTIIIGTLMSYARSCADAKEEVFRKLIFQKKLERFEEHNEKYRQGLVTYTLGINKFAAMTEEEMKAFTHGLVQHAQLSKHRFEIKVWTGETGLITPVKDQRGCGSCRAFSNLSNSCGSGDLYF